MTATTSISAEIVTTGTEILLGDIVDTNAAWIAQQLRENGVNLYYKTTVGDNEGRVRGVLEMVLARSDVVIVTGGLGPTADDITRDAIANATGCPLQRNEAIIAALRERFSRWGSVMSENNKRQADIPAGSTIVPNPQGTAPGFIVRDLRHGRQAYVIALPGVPREMKQMMIDTVIPFLRELTGGQGVIRRRMLRTIGIGESMIDTRIHDLMQNANPTVGTAAKTGQADIRIAARAADAAEAEAMIDEMEAAIRARIGDFIYSTTDDERIETVVARLLAQANANVAFLESSTDGAVAARLAAVTEDARPLAWRTDDEHLPPALAETLVNGGVDEATARQAATQLRQISGATYAVAALGSGMAAEHFYADDPGQSWIALASPEGVLSVRYPFGGRDEITVLRAGHQMLDLLRRTLLGIGIRSN
ncbi:MAG: CinA family nicotinamide mononucleotide deamidase-related protein [Caldilineaceae bacterium]|nr:CinA family nicotinamide mononucleotide deamidase-related protein [Caldilineaceae bacterium]